MIGLSSCDTAERTGEVSARLLEEEMVISGSGTDRTRQVIRTI